MKSTGWMELESTTASYSNVQSLLDKHLSPISLFASKITCWSESSWSPLNERFPALELTVIALQDPLLPFRSSQPSYSRLLVISVSTFTSYKVALARSGRLRMVISQVTGSPFLMRGTVPFGTLLPFSAVLSISPGGWGVQALFMSERANAGKEPVPPNPPG